MMSWGSSAKQQQGELQSHKYRTPTHRGSIFVYRRFQLFPLSLPGKLKLLLDFRCVSPASKLRAKLTIRQLSVVSGQLHCLASAYCLLPTAY